MIKVISLIAFGIILISCEQATPPPGGSMKYDIYRMNLTANIQVDCTDYGDRLIWYNPSNSQYIADELQAEWDRFWPEFHSAILSLLRQNDTPEWGSIDMLEKQWELQVFDGFSADDPMPDGRIILGMVFIVDGKEIYPHWHVFLDDGTVTHSQPVF